MLKLQVNNGFNFFVNFGDPEVPVRLVLSRFSDSAHRRGPLHHDFGGRNGGERRRASAADSLLGTFAECLGQNRIFPPGFFGCKKVKRKKKQQEKHIKHQKNAEVIKKEFQDFGCISVFCAQDFSALCVPWLVM